MNTKSPAISILVPVYKVELYLQRCIDSVLAQDFQDWEMILVDDGSPDRCPQICDEAARKDERISVVHKENGGLPSARLAGFERAKGEYLVFLDSDDYILENGLHELYTMINEGDYDIVRAAIWRTDDNGNGMEARYNKDRGEILRNDQYCLALLKDDIAPYLHSAIFRRCLFNEDVFLTIVRGKISIAEDWMANILIAPKVERVLFIEKPCYAYARNGESMMSTQVRSRIYQERFDVVWLPCVASMPLNVQKEVFAINALKRIRFFFIPELDFNNNDYERIKSLLPSSCDFVSRIPKQYLYFINNRYLYYIYSRLYCFAYWLIKLRGEKRRILY